MTTNFVRIAAFTSVPVIAFALAACSSTSGTSNGSSSPASASSSASATELKTTNLKATDVTVNGFGPTMTVDFPVPSAASELSSKDIKVGTGAAAKVGSSITVNYILKGALSGNVIDEGFGGSVPPFTLAEGQLIEGWVKGIPGMKVGGERILVVPGPLGYGATPTSPSIRPNETLVFVVQLLKVS